MFLMISERVFPVWLTTYEDAKDYAKDVARILLLAAAYNELGRDLKVENFVRDHEIVVRIADDQTSLPEFPYYHQKRDIIQDQGVVDLKVVRFTRSNVISVYPVTDFAVPTRNILIEADRQSYIAPKWAGTSLVSYSGHLVQQRTDSGPIWTIPQLSSSGMWYRRVTHPENPGSIMNTILPRPNFTTSKTEIPLWMRLLFGDPLSKGRFIRSRGDADDMLANNSSPSRVTCNAEVVKRLVPGKWTIFSIDAADEVPEYESSWDTHWVGGAPQTQTLSTVSAVGGGKSE
jgi:hypothetical protein